MHFQWVCYLVWCFGNEQLLDFVFGEIFFLHHHYGNFSTALDLKFDSTVQYCTVQYRSIGDFLKEFDSHTLLLEVVTVVYYTYVSTS